MPDYTTAQAAAELGVSQVWVRKLSERHNLGRLVTPRLRLLTQRDLGVLRQMIGKPPGPVPRGN